jgi:hypothetical protein
MAIAYKRIHVQKYPSAIWIEVNHLDGSSLTDDEADAIMQWTMNNQIGVRMAFQLWKFQTEAELTAFVLKWC